VCKRNSNGALKAAHHPVKRLPVVSPVVGRVEFSHTRPSALHRCRAKREQLRGFTLFDLKARTVGRVECSVLLEAAGELAATRQLPRGVLALALGLEAL
jgi:hypothetical protein